MYNVNHAGCLPTADCQFNDTGSVEWEIGDILPKKFGNICAQEYILMIAWQYKDDI